MRIWIAMGIAGGAALLLGSIGACVGDDAGATPTGDDAATAPDVATGADTSTTCTKTCNGVCAQADDPATGCGGVDCAACPAPNNTTAKCDQGKCAIAGCKAGFSECDSNPANGCETPTSSNPMKCGGCTNVCGNANGTPTCADSVCKFACTGSFAHCGIDDSKGCESDLMTNKDHCGKCGHSCGGGDCVDGKCQALTLFSGDGSPSDLALDATDVYFVNRYPDDGSTAGPGRVLKVGKDGKCGASLTCPVVLVGPTADTDRPVAIAVDANGIYWANLNGLANRANKDGMMVKPLGATALTFGIHVGDGYAWWVNRSGTTKVHRSKADGSVPAGNAFALTATAASYEGDGITGDAAYLYWTDTVAGKIFKVAYGANSTCNLEGNAPPCPTVTAAAITKPYAIALDANNIYVTELLGTGLSRVVKVSKMGGAVTVLATGQDAPQSIATDGVHVYWGNYTVANANDTIRRVSVSAAAPCDGAACEKIADVPFPSAIRVDANAVYWAAQSGKVQKLVKN